MLYIAVIALAVALVLQHQRLRRVEDRQRELLDLLQRGAPDIADPQPRPAPTSVPQASPRPATRTHRPSPPPPPQPVAAAPAQPPRPTFESLIGGKLPIWIGGAALVFAGFFLVRYTLEIGLLGPAMRTTLAALFAVILIIGAEIAVRLPATRDDPRIGQALAGAGIASAYGTLYMAAALYHLVPALPAFIVMLGITALALLLSLRHGPPTAIMALAGGFLAPLVAGFDAAGIGPLLIYLALFTGALFGLAIARGWPWLALAAMVSGFGWINFLLIALAPDRLTGVGGFVVILAIGASLVLPRAGVRLGWLRLAPSVAGLVQLMFFAPALDFGPIAWALYLVLAGAALVLAWRDEIYLPGAIAALALTLTLIAIGLVQADPGVTPWAVFLATALFALPALLLPQNRIWPAIAAIATALPLLLFDLIAHHQFGDLRWFILAAIATIATAGQSWRLRSEPEQPASVIASGLTALLLTVALIHLAGPPWAAPAFAIAMAALGGWGWRLDARAIRLLAAAAFAIACLASPETLASFPLLIGQSIAGATRTFPLLPPLADTLRDVAAPTIVAIALLCWDRRAFAQIRTGVTVSAAMLAILVIYALAKQPLAIATRDAFVTHGMLERVVLTQLCLAAGWALLRSNRLRALAVALIILGLARFVWFDLLLLDPAWLRQAVGPVPILNLAVIDTALTAFWLWVLPPGRATRPAAAVATTIASIALVRQASHGTIMTGPVGIGENWGYSAILLLLALGWLTLGIRRGVHGLRVYGLSLLTLVTLKVFLIDASALTGLLRILSFLGLGVALIGIGWAYGRFLARTPPQPASQSL